MRFEARVEITDDRDPEPVQQSKTSLIQL